MQQDPYQVRVSTDRLCPLERALDVVDRHAELNHRYRKLIHDSREMLAADDVRLTQARGMAKKLMVLVRAAGEGFREALSPEQRAELDAGLTQADDLVHDGDTSERDASER